ncbi:MAG: hypothetical protein QF689_01050 [Candidatus Latescibacteria bacterium]|nr:hypothetical protein [Candidatus Latescibacterota bacterium]
MSRWLGVLLLALVLLGGADTWLRSHRATRRIGDGRLRALVDSERQVETDRVRAVHLRVPGNKGEWHYERRGDTWRFPAYFNAYIHGDRMNSFLDVILGASGTRATDGADDHDELGVADHQGLHVMLHGGGSGAVGGEALADIRLGRGIPGPVGEESYARLAGDDLVLHLHANPIRLLGGAMPPLLDPHLLPRDVKRRTITRARVTSGEGSYLLRRVLAPMPEDAPPSPLDERDRYSWVLERESRIDTCDDTSIYAWMSWVRSVRFERLVDPRDDGYGLGTAGELELTDEEDTHDRLRLGRNAGDQADAGAGLYVGNEVADLVTVMPAGRAQWLLPPARLLLEPLPDPSPFESIP